MPTKRKDNNPKAAKPQKDTAPVKVKKAAAKRSRLDEGGGGTPDNASGSGA